MAQKEVSLLKGVEQLTSEFNAKLLLDKERFRQIAENLDLSTDIDPLSLPTEIWGNVYWEYMRVQDRDLLLTAMFRHTLKRGTQTMPIYRQSENYQSVNARYIQSLADIHRIPLLLKDGDISAGVSGFRAHACRYPSVMKPYDIGTTVPYESGGTKGLPAPTHITALDLEIEGRALANRCFVPGGFHAGANLYNFYNPTHKGGRLIEDAAKRIGKNHIVTRRPEDNLDVCMAKIKAYNTQIIAAVQPPMTPDANTRKGSGVSFINLLGSDHTVFGRKHDRSIVHRAFITGFQLPEPVIELSKEIDMDLFTTWGATEALPGATSTVLGPKTRKCQYNNQHLIMGPNLLSVVKFESGAVVPAKVGEEGFVLVSTIARQGTLFFNYAIGDMATVISNECDCGRTTQIIGNIRRVDDPSEVIQGGCRYC